VNQEFPRSHTPCVSKSRWDDLRSSETPHGSNPKLAGVSLAATFNSTGSVPQPPAQVNGLQAVPFVFATQIDTPVDCPSGIWSTSQQPSK
jgi:hypothetical protein